MALTPLLGPLKPISKRGYGQGGSPPEMGGCYRGLNGVFMGDPLQAKLYILGATPAG